MYAVYAIIKCLTKGEAPYSKPNIIPIVSPCGEVVGHTCNIDKLIVGKRVQLLRGFFFVVL